MDRFWHMSGLVLALWATGCAPGISSSPSNHAPANRLEHYAELPGLSSSPHAGLQAELALLLQEQMTPQALDAKVDAARPSSSKPLAGRQSLQESIPAISRPLLKAQLDAAYRGGELRLSPVQLERAREILRKWGDDRARFEQALADCSRGLGLHSAEGALGDAQFIDVLHLGCRLEALAAAEALAENQPGDAIAPLGTMLQAARVLAQEWNITTRVTAANLRADALHVLDAVANHDFATRETHEQLLALLTAETNDWPSDRAAWIGDRAAGLVTYELIRDGYYLSLLEQSEVQRLRDGNLLDATAQAVMRNLDGDELYYLQAMRRIIESCQQPYFERTQVLDEIRRDLASREQAADYPLVAGRLLLSDFERGHLRQAEDLAQCLAWHAALAAATGDDSLGAVTSPVTGQPLRVQVSPREVRVAGLAPARGEIGLPVRESPAPTRVAGKP